MKGISSRMVGQPLSIPRHKECHDFLGVPLANLAIDRSALLRIHLIPYVFLLLSLPLYHPKEAKVMHTDEFYFSSHNP